MIPRFRPPIGRRELAALLRPATVDVATFEQAFARHFGLRQGLAFPYGRSALWAFFKAHDIAGGEVVVPAYTCSVVGHAVVLSGNRPRFVDIRLDDFNADLDHLASALNEQTRAVIATHLFGYPLDVDRLAALVADAEQRFGRRIWILQDCAHSFGAEWRGRSVARAPDAAFFGLNISKLLTSVFGGMLVSDDEALTARVRAWRDAHFRNPGVKKSLERRLYAGAAWAAFRRPVYGLVHWLQTRTPLLDPLTRAYHRDDQIHFPPDFQDQMLPVEATLGTLQLDRYEAIVQRRRELARAYHERLRDLPGVALPPLVEGATYSHFVLRVPDRAAWHRRLAARGIELGELIQYSLPDLPEYARFTDGEDFPRSRAASREAINLPIDFSLRDRDLDRIVAEVRRAAQP